MMQRFYDATHPEQTPYPRVQYHQDGKVRIPCGDILCNGILVHTERDLAYCPICGSQFVLMRYRSSADWYTKEYFPTKEKLLDLT